MFRSLLENRQGNVAVIFGLCLPVLGIGMGFAVDYSNGTRKQSELQNAADAAALAGARELGLSDGDKKDRERLATATAERFLATRAASAEKTVESSLDEGSVAVRVSVESPQYFGALIGKKTQSISVSAKATYVAQEKTGCLIALSRTATVGIDLQGTPDLSAPKCGIWSNSDSDTSINTQGSGNIKANRICAVGRASGSSRGYEPEPEDGCEPSADPYAGRLPQSPNRCDYTNYVAAKGARMQPGTYCGGISISTTEVTFEPGLYVLKGPLTITSGGSVSGTGVSLLLSGPRAALDIQGGPEITLTAMTTGPLAGIAIAMPDDGFAKTAKLQGNPAMTLSGSIYLPGTHLTLEGTPRLKLSGNSDKLVANSFSMVGTPKIDIKADDRSDEAFDLAKLRLVR